MATATATRRQQPDAPTADPNFQHLPACPVGRFAEDVDLAARVETYRVTLPSLNESRPSPVPAIVTHCVECGAMSYRQER